MTIILQSNQYANLYTMQRIADKARIPINDSAKIRKTDDQLLSYAIDALYLIWQKRPDLFIGQYLTFNGFAQLVLASAFPLDNAYASAVADYVTARTETENDEAVVEQRANLFFNLFKGQI